MEDDSQARKETGEDSPLSVDEGRKTVQPGSPHPGPDVAGDDSDRGKKKWLFVLVSALLLAAVLYKVGFSEVFDELAKVNPWIIVLLALISFSSTLIDTLRWKIFTDALKKTPFRTLLPIYMAGRFANIITPGFKSGGEVIRSIYLAKVTGRTNAECIATVVLDTIVIGLSFFSLVIFAVIYMQFFLEITLQARILVSSIFGLLGVMLFLYLHHRRYGNSEKGKIRFSKFLQFLYRFKFVKRAFFKQNRGEEFSSFEKFVHERVQNFKDTFKGLAGNRALFVRAFSVSFIPIFLIVLESFILLRVRGEDVGFLMVLSVVSFAYFLAYFIPLPGGVGIVEGTMIGLYTANGVDPGVAAAVTIIDRGLYMLYGVGGGYLSLNYLGYKYHVKGGDREDEKKDDGAKGEFKESLSQAPQEGE